LERIYKIIAVTDKTPRDKFMDAFDAFKTGDARILVIDGKMMLLLSGDEFPPCSVRVLLCPGPVITLSDYKRLVTLLPNRFSSCNMRLVLKR